MTYEVKVTGGPTYNVALVRRFIEAIDNEAKALNDVRKLLAEFDAEAFNGKIGGELLRAASVAGHWAKERAAIGERCARDVYLSDLMG